MFNNLQIAINIINLKMPVTTITPWLNIYHVLLLCGLANFFFCLQHSSFFLEINFSDLEKKNNYQRATSVWSNCHNNKRIEDKFAFLRQKASRSSSRDPQCIQFPVQFHQYIVCYPRNLVVPSVWGQRQWQGYEDSFRFLSRDWRHWREDKMWILQLKCFLCLIVVKAKPPFALALKS